MTVSLKHAFQSAVVDENNPGEVGPDEWNAEHTLLQATGKLLGRTTAGTGATEEITPSARFSFAGGAIDLASVISAGGPTGSATVAPILTWDVYGRLTAVSSATITPAAASITGGAALSKADDTNVTLTLGGAPTSALLAATSLTLGWSGTLAVSRGGTGTGSAGGTALDNISGFASTGHVVRTGSGTYAFRTLTAPAAGITVTNGSGVGGDPTLVLADDLAALEALSGTNTIYYRSAASTWTAVTIGSGLAFAGGTLSSGSGTNSYTDGMINGTFAVSAAGSALTIALKTAAGSDPSGGDAVTVLFRNVTAATGDYTSLSISAATSVVVSSGSTLGVTSSTAFRLWIVGFNDGGTFRLGVINCSTATQIFPLTESGVASSTAEGGAGAADSAGVIYTGTAVTSKAYRILGYLEWSSSGLTAGTWTTTNHSLTQLFAPGNKLPGDPIQTVITTPTANDSSASPTYVATTTTQAITLTSAANLVRAEGSGAGDTVAANRVISVRLSRGTTANTNMFGSSGVGFHGTARLITAVSMLGYDKPNTTSSTTYAVQQRDDTSGGSNWGAGGNVVALALTEMMG